MSAEPMDAKGLAKDLREQGRALSSPTAGMWPAGDLMIRAADFLDALPGQDWQPIETAPKDGTTILLYCPQGDGNPGSSFRVTAGDWLSDPGGTTEFRDGHGRWIDQDDREGFEGWMSWDGGFSEDTMMPTHWQPLPAPPPPGGDKP